MAVTTDTRRKGRQTPTYAGVIAERIQRGELSTKLSPQQYLKHVDGTVQYQQYAMNRKAPQSRLTISQEQAQAFITRYCGTGDPRGNCSDNIYLEYVMTM